MTIGECVGQYNKVFDALNFDMSAIFVRALPSIHMERNTQISLHTE